MVREHQISTLPPKIQLLFTVIRRMMNRVSKFFSISGVQYNTCRIPTIWKLLEVLHSCALKMLSAFLVGQLLCAILWLLKKPFRFSFLSLVLRSFLEYFCSVGSTSLFGPPCVAINNWWESERKRSLVFYYPGWDYASDSSVVGLTAWIIAMCARFPKLPT